MPNRNTSSSSHQRTRQSRGVLVLHFVMIPSPINKCSMPRIVFASLPDWRRQHEPENSTKSFVLYGRTIRPNGFRSEVFRFGTQLELCVAWSELLKISPPENPPKNKWPVAS